MASRVHSEYGTLDVQKARTELLRYIAQKGLKQTRQRELIAAVFFAAGEHMSVEDLLARARKKDARVSAATVYRTMRLLSECGLASARHFDDERGTLFEPAGNRHHHDHLICTSCHTIVEFEDDRIEVMQDRIAARYGFEIISHKHELYGLCERCRSRHGGDR